MTFRIEQNAKINFSIHNHFRDGITFLNLDIEIDPGIVFIHVLQESKTKPSLSAAMSPSSMLPRDKP